MTLVMEGMSVYGYTSMPSLSLIIGTVFSGNRDAAMRIGLGLYFLVLGSLIPGFFYALFLSLFEMPEWWVGALLGSVNGVLVGVGLGQIGRIHPRMVDGPGARPVMVRSLGFGRSEVAIARPGIFGLNWGDLTPVVITIAYAVFGIVFFLIYSWMS